MKGTLMATLIILILCVVIVALVVFAITDGP